MDCPVCYETRAPNKLCCGHDCCAACVEKWRAAGGESCPTCRTPLDGPPIDALDLEPALHAAFLRGLQQLHDEFQRLENGPSHVVMFETYLRHIEGWLEQEMQSPARASGLLVQPRIFFPYLMRSEPPSVRASFAVGQPSLFQADVLQTSDERQARIGEQMRRAERRAQRYRR